MSFLRKNNTVKRVALVLVLVLIIMMIPDLATEAKKKSTVKGTVTAAELYMRSGPGTEYTNILSGGEKVVLTKDQEVTVLGERNDWYHIKVKVNGEELEGYSLAKWISVDGATVKAETGEFKEITPTPTATPTPTPTPAPTRTGKGKVTASQLNIRKGPGTDYEIVQVKGENAVLVKDQAVSLYGEKDGWYHITAKINGKKTEGYSLGTYIEITSGKVEPEKDEVPTPTEKVTPTDGPTPAVTPGPEPTEDITPVPTGDVTPTPDPDEEPKDTPFPTEMLLPLPTGSAVTDDGTVYDMFGNELETVTNTYSSKYDMKGIVTADLLNLRESPSLDCDVLGIISKDAVVSLVGTRTNSIDFDGEGRQVRWYRVLAFIEGEYIRGYVLSDYVKLNYCNELKALTNTGKQILRTEADGSSAKVKTSKGKKVSIAKNSAVTVLAEEQVGNDKWIKISADYSGETVTGWLLALRVTFVSNADSIELQNYRIKEKEAEITVTVTPEITMPPVDPIKHETVENANGIMKDAAALSLKTEPKYSSSAVFTNSKKPVFVYSGQGVRIIETATDGENLWCLIEVVYDGSLYTGYVNSIYVDADSSVNMPSTTNTQVLSSASFEEELAKEGFPDSYKPFLRALHEQYPNWKFKSFQTGLDWDTVIKKESEVGVNLIPNTKSVEWKSLEAGAYSWTSDKFTVFDGSSWVTASKEAISYYMDPRNFLEYNTIFQFELLNYNPSYQTKEGIDTILKNTAMKESSYIYTDDLGNKRSISFTDTFAMAAEYSGVSPLHLASRVKQEVTIGATAMSNSVTGTVAGYEGLYNYFNIGAYHSTEPGGAIANGLKFAQNGSSSDDLNMKCLIPWNNRLRSIFGGAFYIGNNYINRGQNTIYLQKFNMTATSTYNHQYMANVEAPYSEGKRFFSAYENPGDIPIVFSIPVYLNMPETPCPVPQKAYNPNNWLKSLKLYDKNGNALSLTPTFSAKKDQEYNLIVGNETDYIKISATTVSSLAKVEGDGYYYPSVGTNRMVIPVRAENGDVREYVINIVREEQAATPTPTPTPTPEETPTPTPEETPTPTPEETPTPTPEETPTPTPEETPTPTPEETPTPTPEETPTPTPEDTPTPTPEETPTPTPEDTPTPTPDDRPTATPELIDGIAIN